MKKLSSLLVVMMLLMLTLVACKNNAKKDNSAEESGAEKQAIQYNISDEPLAFVSDYNQKFTLQDENYVTVYDIAELDKDSGTIIEINPDKTYQRIDGFGASFTQTSAYLLSKLSDESRKEVMTYLFDNEKGIGINFLRNPTGVSDFSLEYISYDDMPEGEEDWELAHFDGSSSDEQIALTKEAMEVNPNIKLFLAPWSPPLWMKTSYEWNTDKGEVKLRRDCYDVYADYLVKSIELYEEQGIPVFSITPQNEPFSANGWPSMNWDWEDLANFTNDNLRPALDEAGLETKILNLDYNFIYHEEADKIMASTMNTADGVAYHKYSGYPEDMQSTVQYFPNKLIYVTEASHGGASSMYQLTHTTVEMGRCLRSGAMGYILWNMALDETGGPTYNNVNTHCSSLVTCDSETNEVTYGSEYYAMGHYSKFIHEGAVLVDSTDTGLDTSYKLVNVVTLNPNGSMTAVVTNEDSAESKVCKIVMNNRVMEFEMAPRSVVTLTWDAN